MNIYDQLQKDHEHVSALFDKLQDTTTGAVKTRGKLFEELKRELELHASVEEDVFYSILKAKETSRSDILEAIQEHELIRTLLSELEEMPFDKEEWLAKLTVLQENVGHHVEEEEGDLFAYAQKLINADEAKELGKHFQEEKAQRMETA